MHIKKTAACDKGMRWGSSGSARQNTYLSIRAQQWVTSRNMRSWKLFIRTFQAAVSSLLSSFKVMQLPYPHPFPNMGSPVPGKYNRLCSHNSPLPNLQYPHITRASNHFGGSYKTKCQPATELPLLPTSNTEMQIFTPLWALLGSVLQWWCSRAPC